MGRTHATFPTGGGLAGNKGGNWEREYSARTGEEWADARTQRDGGEGCLPAAMEAPDPWNHARRRERFGHGTPRSNEAYRVVVDGPEGGHVRNRRMGRWL